jgi:uncharacterized membrane protein
MILEQIVHLLGLFAWLGLSAYTFPGIVRVLRSRPEALDPIKAALFFIAATQFYLMTIRGYYGASLWQRTGVLWWTIAGVLVTLSVVTLVVAFYKTDRALRSLGP